MRGDEMRVMRRNVGEAYFGERFAPKNVAASGGENSPLAPRTRLSHEGMVLIGVKSHARAETRLRENHKASRTTSISGLRSGSIRENIIGRTLRAGIVGFGAREGVRHVAGALAFLEKQPGHGGAGLIGQPLIHQSGNLLAKIRGIGQPGKFEALQRVFGGREQEVPRWFRRVCGHVHLQHCHSAHNKKSVTTVNSTKH